MTVCETRHLRLRRLTPDDAAFILALLTDADFLTNVGDRGVHDLEQARLYIARGPEASYARHGFGLWGAQLKGTGETIGLCGLLHRDTHPDVEIGFAVLPAYRGQGYALEAARAALQVGIEAYGLRRLVALTVPSNHKSSRILTTLGFRFSGLVHLTPDGGESHLYVLDVPPRG